MFFGGTEINIIRISGQRRISFDTLYMMSLVASNPASTQKFSLLFSRPIIFRSAVDYRFFFLSPSFSNAFSTCFCAIVMNKYAVYTNEVGMEVLYLKVEYLNRLIELLAINPRTRFGIPKKDDEWCVWNMSDATRVDPETFLTMGKASPFTGREVFGICLATTYGGKTVWQIK